MTKIVGIIQPFDITQHLYVYQDGKKICSKTFALHDISNTLFKLCKNYNTNIIELSAPHHYLQGLIQSIKKDEQRQREVEQITFRCSLRDTEETEKQMIINNFSKDDNILLFNIDTLEIKMI